ncbi:hypothetical protein F5888DRAFT_1695905 [Russula emetica]|nr:hypothetical protein F5888DRAFT_1695905 [Russula emetica]
MSLSSFSSLSSYSSESDIGTLLDFNLFKSSSSRPRADANANAHAHTRRRSSESPRIKDRDSKPSPSSRHTHTHTHTRAKRRSITPTRTPVSSSKYDDGSRALVPYSFHSPGSKSGISYSDIDRWRAGTVGGSDFTYSSESSVTVSSVTSPSYNSSASRTRSSRIDSSSRRSAASDYKRLKAPSIASQHPHPAIHHDPSQICEHCHRPPHQIHGRTDVLPALRLEPYSAFLAAYRLSRLSCPDALERSTTLDPDDPFTIPPGLSEHPTIPPHLHPELSASERRARRLALLLDSDDPEIRDWAQAEYLKLGRNERRLVREGVFEVKVALDGVDEHIPEDWSANEREEDLEKLKERLERAKESREEREEVEREMGWAREMFGKWFIDGRVDGVFRLAADVLDGFLKEVARDEGEEWVIAEAKEEAAEGQSPTLSKVVPKSRGPSSTLGSKTLGAEQVAPMLATSSASVASSKRKGKQRPEPTSKVEREPEPEPEPEPTSAPAADPEPKVEDPEPALVESPRAQSHADPSPERSPSPVPVPLPVLHPSIFSEDGLLNYAINSIHPEPPPEPSAPVEQEQVRAESQVSSDNHTITPQDRSPNPAVQHDTYADFYAKDSRRRRTPLLHVKPLPNNQPLPKPEREYDSYADFYANDSRLMKHVDDRPLPALVKKEAAKTADRSSRPQSSSKPPKLTIPSKAPADPPRVSEPKPKHRRRSDSRHRHRHKSQSSFEDFAVSSKISGSSGRLTTPAASDVRSRSRSRENRHRSHRKSAHKSRRPSPGLTSPTPSHGSRRRRDSHSRRETPPLPVPAPKPKPVLTSKRSWVPFRMKGGALSNGTPSRTSSPEPIPVMPHGTSYNVPGALTSTMASDQGEREDGGKGDDGCAQEDAVVPPAPPLPPVQFWLPGFPAYKMNLGRSGGSVSASTEDDRRRRRHRDHHHNRHSSSTFTSTSVSSASSTSRVLQPIPPPPVFLALGARRACVPYTPAFQGIDVRVVRPLSAREKLAMRDAVSVLVRLGAKVVGAEAGGLGVRGEMWSLSYVGFQ